MNIVIATSNIHFIILGHYCPKSIDFLILKALTFLKFKYVFHFSKTRFPFSIAMLLCPFERQFHLHRNGDQWNCFKGFIEPRPKIPVAE